MIKKEKIGYADEIIYPTSEARKKSKVRMTCTLGEMVDRVKAEPAIPMLYSVIKEGSVGLVYGVAKTGKTIFCENLAMSIASGRKSYLGKPINSINKKVLFVSFEEFYAGRTSRNIKQMEVFSRSELENLENNYFVITEHAPKVLATKEDWNFLRDEIEKIRPSVVFLDSLTRIVDGQIENSDTAKDAMLALREIAEDYKVTLITIHHSIKIDEEKVMSQQNVAGSRVISQESDFILGINKTSDNIRYIKLVSARYADDNSPNVAKFELDQNLWINIIGTAREQDLLTQKIDRRRDNSSFTELMECVKSLSSKEELIRAGDIKKCLVPELMSEKTMYKNLEKGLESGLLINPEKGFYCFKS